MKVETKTVKIMVNCLKACLNLYPQCRPTPHEIFDHKMFGGSVNFKAKKKDIWSKKGKLPISFTTVSI